MSLADLLAPARPHPGADACPDGGPAEDRPEPGNGNGSGNGRAAAVHDAATDRLELVERCAWSLVWLGVLVGGCDLWGSWWSWPAVDALAPALVGVALAGFAICWCGASPRSWLHQGLALASVLAAIATPQFVSLHTRLYYSTDSAALDEVAGRVLAKGHDPYTSSLAAAARLFKTPTSFWTYTVSGGHVANVSYPAGSFLAYAFGFALGFHHDVVDWVDLYAWLAALVLLFFLLPRDLRWLGALVGLVGFFVNAFANGGTDALFVPLTLLAVWRWDRYGRGRGAGLAGWIGPVALGLACSVKQTPWFCVPFLVVGVAFEAHRSGRPALPLAARYLAVVLGAFTVVNLPFMVWSPEAWWRGTLTPIAQPLVADGQGLVSLALHGLTGGADLRLLTDATGLVLLALLAGFAAWYDRLKRIWPLLLPVVFFVSPRSLSSYLIDLFPLAVVALATTEPAVPVAASRRRWPVRPMVLATGVLAAAAAVTAALSFTGAPLLLRYRSADVGPHQQRFYSLSLTVTNETGGTVVPHFMVDLGAPHPTGFWTPAHHRPVVLGPHRSATVTLYPPAQMYLPPWASDYVVQAYTADPRALSTTKDIWHNYVPTRTSRRS